MFSCSKFFCNRKIKQLNKKINDLQYELNIYKTHSSNDIKCCICLDNPKTYANIYCGHLSSCSKCYKRLHSTCPLCKKKGPFVKIYI